MCTSNSRASITTFKKSIIIDTLKGEVKENHIKQSIKTREGRKIVEAKNGNKGQMQ